MVKSLTAHSNSSAIIIEKPILELLNIGPETPLQITTDGKNIIISPLHNSKGSKNISSALSRVNKRHGKTLKALAA